MTHDSHFLTFMKRFTFKSVFSGTICSRRNVPLYFFYKVQKIGYQKHDNNRHRNGECSACDHTEVFMAVESLGKCLHALQVAFSDYSRNHCRLISRLVIKKNLPMICRFAKHKRLHCSFPLENSCTNFKLWE